MKKSPATADGQVCHSKSLWSDNKEISQGNVPGPYNKLRKIKYKTLKNKTLKNKMSN